jgi:hypothetical protein
MRNFTDLPPWCEAETLTQLLQIQHPLYSLAGDFGSGAGANRALFALRQPSGGVAASPRYALPSPEPLQSHDS